MSSAGVEANLVSVGNNGSASQSSPNRRNRKRISPENSVSLRHGKYSSSAAEPNKAFATPPTLQHGNRNSHRASLPSSYYKQRAGEILLQQSYDSGIGPEGQQSINDIDRESGFNSNESNDRSVPEDWFKSWNTDVGEINHPNLADGDSPYYLSSERQRRKQKYEINKLKPKISSAPIGEIATGSRIVDPTRSTNLLNPSYPSMNPSQDSEDESDVYRSVIDDLTIKNKKLKKKLRKMERLHCNELNEEKLFEVRCYGLPPAQKQELQELLQKFAAAIDGGAGGVYDTKRAEAVSSANATLSTNPSSSSFRQNTDSAYATETRMTSLDGGSVDVSKVKSSIGQSLDKPKATPVSNTDVKPIQFANERTKMKLVVRRLEQLFTGRDALRSKMEKSEAQQQLDAAAAPTDKIDFVVDDAAESGDEGDRREAAMMSMQQDDDLTKGRNQDHASHQRRHSLDTSHQRPTRPIDLDLNRAQVAAENVEYLEHMSFSSSHKSHNSRPASAGEGTEWVYLNLINNLAQIHTLNVSLSFIKKSIRTLSDKLELSPDGNKVRWRGGLAGTRLSTDGDTSSGVDNSSPGGASSPGEASPVVRFRDNASPPGGKASINPTSMKDVRLHEPHGSSPGMTSGDVSSGVDNFRYRPLMFHTLPTQKSSSDDNSDEDSSESGSEADTNNTKGPPPMVESGTAIGLSDIGKFAPVDGPIIYFGGAPFCTDLSAQIVFREGGHTFLGNHEARNYHRFVKDPIGKTEDRQEPETPTYRSLLGIDWDSQDSEMDSLDSSGEGLPQLMSNASASAETQTSMPAPYPFGASGLGGVRPEDNFVVYVKTTQKIISSPKFRISKPYKIRHRISSSALSAILENNSEFSSQQNTEIGFENEITDAIQIRLQPSKLPDPTFALSLSEGSSDPFLSTSDEPRSYESHLSFAYNIEEDSRSSGEGIPSFHSPDIDDQSAMDLDVLDGLAVGDNPLAPLSVAATAGDLTDDASEVESLKDIPILQSLDDMDITSADVQF